MPILFNAQTDIGQKRQTNQDSICTLKEYNFFAVADGMGGHNGGDIASQMSAKIFPEFFSDNDKFLETEELLEKSIKYINKAIYDHGQQNEELKGMGTTISAIKFDQEYANLANVGDSRIYLVHKKKLYQLTRDHSLVQEKLNLGIYDRQGAKRDPQKNVLIRTVGFEPVVEVDIYKYRTNLEDIFLVCSDGLHGKVADSDILKIINTNIPVPSEATQEQVDNAVSQLIYQANVNGGQDNISVIIALIKE